MGSMPVDDGGSESGKRFVYCAMYMLGASAVVPWLAYITPVDYFIRVFPDHPEIEYDFALVTMGMMAFGTIFMLKVGIHWDLHLRMVGSMISIILLMCCVPLFNMLMDHPRVLEHVSKTTFFRLTVLSRLFCAAGCAIQTSTLYGLAGVLGGEFTQALEAGKGAASVLIVLLRMLTKAVVSPDEIDLSMYSFFAMSILVLIIALLMYEGMRATPFSKSRYERYQLQSQGELVGMNTEDMSESGIAGPGLPAANRATEETALINKSPSHQQVYSSSANESETTTNGGGGVRVTHVFSKLMRTAVGVCVVFSVCLALFPGLTTSFRSTSLHLGDWFPVFLIGVYSLGDLIGKTLPGMRLLFSYETIFAPIAVHLLFVPLFVMTARHPEAVGDFLSMVMVGALGISTGYLGCSCMMLGPKQVEEHEREVAGQIMSLSLIGGLFFGSVLGFVLNWVVQL